MEKDIVFEREAREIQHIQNLLRASAEGDVDLTTKQANTAAQVSQMLADAVILLTTK